MKKGVSGGLTGVLTRSLSEGKAATIYPLHHSPGLWLPKMQVVDTVEIHVLCMPGECCLPHPEVEVGGVHPFYDNATLMFHHV